MTSSFNTAFSAILHIQQRGADEAVVRVSQVVEKKREGPDCRRPRHLIRTLQRLGED